MSLRILAGMLSGVCLISTSLLHAAEAVPAQSVGELAVFVAYEKFRIYADACSQAAPASKADNLSVMERVTTRTRAAGDSLLATVEFGGLKRQVPTSAFVTAVRADLDQLGRQHASTVTLEGCKGAMDNFRAMDDNKIAFGVASLLREFQTFGTLAGVGGARNRQD